MHFVASRYAKYLTETNYDSAIGSNDEHEHEKFFDTDFKRTISHSLLYFSTFESK